MKEYNDFFLLDIETVKDFVKNVTDYFDKNEELKTEEIGDGNINYVFKVKGKAKSLIVKQADECIRTSGRPLDMARSEIEADVLRLENKLAPAFVPRIYYYDSVLHATVMEDISAYKNLRQELMNGKMFANLPENITDFLVMTLLPTTDLVLDRAIKKEKVKNFINPELCDISEDLVFTEPYYDYKKRNIISIENLEFVKKELYSDNELKVEVAKLRNKFMNYAQCLLHGDLHSGSIFINNSGIKVIDPEFAFYGPMGYDVGNVIGNLVFSLIYQGLVVKNLDFYEHMTSVIAETFELFRKKLDKSYDEIVTFPFYTLVGFKEDYIKGIVADSIGFAGTEIIRRVVGDAKVKELTSIENLGIRIEVERILIKIGKRLIKKRNDIVSSGKLLENIRG